MTLADVKEKIEWLLDRRKEQLFVWRGRKNLKENHILQGEQNAYANALAMLNEIDNESEEDDDNE